MLIQYLKNIEKYGDFYFLNIQVLEQGINNK
jgi:hypothetical protein